MTFANIYAPNIGSPKHTKQILMDLKGEPITLFGICQKELKIYVHTKTHTWMLIAAQLIIAKSGKQ